MKNIRLLLTAVLMVLAVTDAAAQDEKNYDFVADGIFYKIDNLKPADVSVVHGDTLYSGDIVLPDSVTHEGKTFCVSSVGAGAFENCKGLTSIDLGVTGDIGYSAFAGCTALCSIDMKNVKIIGSYAFKDCGLTSVDFKNVTEIGDDAFEYCRNLVSISLRNVKSIGEKAFGSCRGLTKVKTHETVPPEIGSFSFDGMTSLNATLYVPHGCRQAYMDNEKWGRFANIKEMAAEKYSLRVHCSRGGTVMIGDSLFADGVAEMMIAKGDSVAMKIVPAKGYKMQSVMANGEDVSEQIADSMYRFKMDGDVRIEVVFAELPLTLTIKHADNGNVVMAVETGKAYSFVINAAEGWTINTVTFNGNDVTAELNDSCMYTTPAITENAVLNVSFETLSTSAEALSAPDMKVMARNGMIVVEGAERGAEVRVFTMDGVMAASALSDSGSVCMPVLPGRAYVVRIGNRAFKIAM